MSELTPEEINAHQTKMWEAAATVLEEAKATFDKPAHNSRAPYLTGEHMMAGSPFRIRISRLRNGGTKIIILEHDWLKSTGGRE